jgi:hypothetical protein
MRTPRSTSDRIRTRAAVSASAQFAREPALQDAVRRLQAGQTLLLLFLGAEDADEDACVPRSGEVSTPVTVTKPILGSLRSPTASDKDLTDSLVHASHAAGHAGIQPRVALHALALAAVAAWCFVTALAGGLSGSCSETSACRPSAHLFEPRPPEPAQTSASRGSPAATAAVTQGARRRIHWRVFWWMVPPSVVGASSAASSPAPYRGRQC